MTLVDLSRPIREGAPVYPGDPLFQARPFATHAADGFRATRWIVGSHLNTHLDAPLHYFVDGESLDSFPVDFFCGDAFCLDCAALVGPDSARYARRRATGRPAALEVEDLEPFDAFFDAAPIALLRVDWARKFGARDFFADFPSLSVDLCDWLADFPNLRILGLETPSLVAEPPLADDDENDVDDRANPFDDEFAELLEPHVELELEPDEPDEPSDPRDPAPLQDGELCADAECHRVLLGRRPPILILEGLVALERLPRLVATPGARARVPFDRDLLFQISCFPLPVEAADGAPTRAVATLRDDQAARVEKTPDATETP